MHKNKIVSFFFVSTTYFAMASAVTLDTQALESSSLATLLLFGSFALLSLAFISGAFCSRPQNGQGRQQSTVLPRDDVTLGDKVADSAFAEVYKGTYQGKPCALKKLKNVEQLRQVKEKFNTLTSLHHPHLIEYYAIVDLPSGSYIATEWVEGAQPSDTFLRQEKEAKFSREQTTITDEKIKTIALQIGNCLAYLEEKGVYPSILSLHNVLLTPTLSPKLSDVGLTHTVEGTFFMNDTKYSAPECYDGEGFVPKSASWAFGVLLWQLYSWGEVPFEKLSNYEVSKAIRKGERLKSPSGCPALVWALMAKSWNSKPQNRPTLQDFKKSLAVEAKEDVDGGKKYEYSAIPAAPNNVTTLDYGRIPKNEEVPTTSEYGSIPPKKEEKEEEGGGEGGKKEEEEEAVTPAASFDVNKVIYGQLPRNSEEESQKK